MANVASTNTVRDKFKQALLLWFEGFREACCFHRVVYFCLRSKMLSIRTGQCFLLNGFIFLGSMFILKSVVIPVLQWILPDQCQQFDLQDSCPFGGIVKFYSILHAGLIQLFYIEFEATDMNSNRSNFTPSASAVEALKSHFSPTKQYIINDNGWVLQFQHYMKRTQPTKYFRILWFYPLYVFSLLLSTIWYNDIAKYAYVAMGRHGPVEHPSGQKELVNSRNLANADKPAGLEGVIIGIGEQVYSVLLLSFFFIEVFVVGFIPYGGKALNFLLLSWMYAYYCFEYKWNLSEVGLDKRLNFFESNWSFFAGFGSPCVLAIFFFSPLVSYGVMAMLFPLFVLAATGSDAEKVLESQRKMGRGAGLGRLPIFFAADTLSLWVLSLFHDAPHGRREDKEL